MVKPMFDRLTRLWRRVRTAFLGLTSANDPPDRPQKIDNLTDPPERVRMTIDLARAIAAAMQDQQMSTRAVAQLTETTDTPVTYQTVQNYVHAPPGRMVDTAKLAAVLVVLGLEDRLEELTANGGEWRMPVAFDAVPEADRRRIEEFLDWVLFRRR
jgi:hypothetical protein